MIVSRTLYTEDPYLDLQDGIGQRASTFQFDLINGVTGGKVAELTPIRGASLSHNTTQTTKRRLNMSLGVVDTALVNPINNRVDVTMILGDGSRWPLGRYVFTDLPRREFTSGDLSTASLTDEMITVDQQVTKSINGFLKNANLVAEEVIADFDFASDIAGSGFVLSQSWGPGASRGQILESIAINGDYFSPWFGNDGAFHMIRSFDPADAIPTFNYDIGNQVLRTGVTHNDDTLIAPNRFLVIGNAAAGFGSRSVVGVADVPDSAPHSAKNRGFVITSVSNLPVTNTTQAYAVANNLAIQQTIAEELTLVTAVDPRHDSYDVVIWQGEKWLEIGWTMSLTAGGTMSHNLKKAYS